MRALRRIFSRFYVYVLWFFFAFVVCGLLFSRLGDASAAHKVTLFADVPAAYASLAGEVKECGEYEAAVKLYKAIKGTFKFNVVAE